jgi:hypothetical protein
MEWFHNFSKQFHIKPDRAGDDEALFASSVRRLQQGQAVLDAPCGHFNRECFLGPYPDTMLS